jgi:hypothetical protein
MLESVYHFPPSYFVLTRFAAVAPPWFQLWEQNTFRPAIANLHARLDIHTSQASLLHLTKVVLLFDSRWQTAIAALVIKPLSSSYLFQMGGIPQ